MSKIPELPRIAKPPATESPYITGLYRSIVDSLIGIASQINLLSEDKISGSYGARTAQPSTVIQAIGDFTKNIVPAEAGTAGAKYVVLGWITTVNGTASAATSLEVRALTGN